VVDPLFALRLPGSARTPSAEASCLHDKGRSDGKGCFGLGRATTSIPVHRLWPIQPNPARRSFNPLASVPSAPRTALHAPWATYVQAVYPPTKLRSERDLRTRPDPLPPATGARTHVCTQKRGAVSNSGEGDIIPRRMLAVSAGGQRLCPSPTASSHPTPLHDTRVRAGGEQDERQRNDLQGGHVRRGALRPVLNALRKSVRASLIIDLGGKWLMIPPAKPF
jgi:hypothetical protein